MQKDHTCLSCGTKISENDFVLPVRSGKYFKLAPGEYGDYGDPAQMYCRVRCPSCGSEYLAKLGPTTGPTGTGGSVRITMVFIPQNSEGYGKPQVVAQPPKPAVDMEKDYFAGIDVEKLAKEQKAAAKRK